MVGGCVKMRKGERPFLIRKGGMHFMPEASITCRQGHHQSLFWELHHADNK